MPQPILTAYKNYLENMYVYNCLAGGIGRPFIRKCGIPQGCPFSMAMVALIMRPWILLMRKVGDTKCFILADDVLVVATGKHMAKKFVRALDQTHIFLHDMGAQVAPSKRFNFTTHRKVKTWLGNYVWPALNKKIHVADELRYLGAQVTATFDSLSGTLEARIDKALVQLKRLRRCPANVDMKARIIATKIYAGALYGVETATITPARIAKLSAAVVDTFRSKNNSYNADRFYATLTKADNDLDPTAQILARRILQIRRTSCKKDGAEEYFKRVLKKYAERHKVGGKWPGWYMANDEGENNQPLLYPPEQPHPSTKEHQKHWNQTITPVGPVGQLIESVLWHGLVIDDQLKVHQRGEPPLDIIKTPFQNLKSLSLRAAARARTRAEWARQTGHVLRNGVQGTRPRYQPRRLRPNRK